MRANAVLNFSKVPLPYTNSDLSMDLYRYRFVAGTMDDFSGSGQTAVGGRNVDWVTSSDQMKWNVLSCDSRGHANSKQSTGSVVGKA